MWMTVFAQGEIIELDDSDDDSDDNDDKLIKRL
jgi:hypothetical protein